MSCIRSTIQPTFRKTILSSFFSGDITRNFLTFGGINESGSIPAWTATGDFSISIDFATTSTGFVSLLSSSSDGATLWAYVDATSHAVNFRIDGVHFVSPQVAVNDGKLHTATLTRVGNLFTAEVEGTQESTTQTVASVDIETMGYRGTFAYFDGILANISLTEAGGDNRFYPMSGGRSGEGAYELDSLATLGAENVVNGDFSGGTTGWSLVGDSFSVVDGALQVVGSANTNRAVGTVTGLTAGQPYTFSGSRQSVSGAEPTFIVWNAAESVVLYNSGASSGSSDVTITPTDTSVVIWLRVDAGASTFDNISIKEAPNAMLLNNIVASDWELFTQVQKEISRAALTFGGVNESGSIPTWTASGDFEIEVGIATTDTSALPTILGNNSDTLSFLSVSGATGVVRSRNPSGREILGTIPVNDGKLHTIKLSVVSGTASLFVDGVPDGSVSGIVGSSVYDAVGKNQFGNYCDGVITNISLTEAGGDNRFYAMISGSTTTEPDTLGDGSTDMTLNNIVADDWGTIVTQPVEWLGVDKWSYGQVVFDGTELAFEDVAGLTVDPAITTDTDYRIGITGDVDQSDAFLKTGDGTTLVPASGSITSDVNSGAATRNKVQTGSSVPITGTATVSVKRLLQGNQA